MEAKQLTPLQQKARALLARWPEDALTTQLGELEARTLAPNFWSQPEAQAVMRQLSECRASLAQSHQLQEALDELETAILVLADEPDNAVYLTERDRSAARLEALIHRLELQTYLTGKYDRADAIFGVHAGQGGTEAMDWAEMLARAYGRFFERQGWQSSLIDESRGEEAGIKSVTYTVRGQNAYGLLKHEAGTHRLVRLSPFNADNLRQTSFALVEVLPLLSDDDKDITLNDADLSWHFTRAGGAGGQNVNKVNTAVELTYLPLGIVVRCREERSQAQNKQRALQILKAHLALMQEQQQTAEISALKAGNTQASWGTQIRNYVLHPYQLVKDVRTGVETADTAGVLDGDFGPFIDAALAQSGAK